MMKFSILAIASIVVSASAFVPNTACPSRSGSVMQRETVEDLKVLAEKANPVIKFYDPINLSDTTLFDNTNEQSINFLRHAEIKHGRVAMAAFVGYLVQSNGLHWNWPTDFGGSPFPFAAGSPPEQWDAMSQASKWQIILFIGFLEWFSEAAGTHYMRGGIPGKYPNFSDHPDVVPHPVPFNLYDPFGLSKSASEEKKANGLVKEINNGRLAMLGIIGFLSEQKVEGSVPALKGLVAHYDGELMAPF